MKKVLLLLSVCFVFSSCFIGKMKTVSEAKKEFTVEKNAIPKDFGNDSNTILLCVLKDRKSYDKYLKNKVEKKYHGNTIFILEDDLQNNPKYQDVNKYRYVFDYKEGKPRTVTTTMDGQMRQNTVHYKQFYIKDRKNNQVYLNGSEYSLFAKAMEVYFENLEQVRTSNLN